MSKHHKRHSRQTIQVGSVIIREKRSGYYLADFQLKGKRVRKGFSDLAEAKVYAAAKTREIQNKGLEALSLSDALRLQALQAIEILRGTGGTLVDAAKEYARRHPAIAGEPFAVTCDRYLSAMAQEHRRQASQDDKRLKLAALSLAFGTTPTSAIDRQDLATFCKGRWGNPRTADAYCKAGLTVLRYFQAGALRQRRSADETPPATWDSKTVMRLLRCAEEHAADCTAGFAILFFAGVRPTELLRLQWEAIDLEERVIRLTGSDTKTRTMRHVDISQNLLAWLVRYRKQSGSVVPTPALFRQGRELAMEKAGIKAWPTDVARHTYATMHYNAHQNAAATMAQLGHFGNPQTFVTHYKGVPVTPSQATAYWSIGPAQPAGRAILFEQAG